MKAAGIEFDFANAGMPIGRVSRASGCFKPLINYVKGMIEKNDYSSDAASLILPSETKFLRESRSLAREFSGAEALVIVGIGGSNLGTSAVMQAVKGSFYNLENPDRQVFFADTTDSRAIAAIAKLTAKKKVVLNAVSKSGSTTETIANLRVLLKQFAKKPHVVVTTDGGSKFEAVAKKAGHPTLEIPAKVGGRYSVFSSVGLFPLSWVGLDCHALLAGAKEMRDKCLKEGGEDNPASSMAILLHANAMKGRRIHDHFLFATDLEGVGKWYRQLLGESIGKEWDYYGKRRVRTGITPTVSIGSTDLHSVGQLYFGGPRDKFFRIVSVAGAKDSPKVPTDKAFDKLVPSLSGKSLDRIMSAIVEGTKGTMRKQGLPFASVSLPDLKEHAIGALMQEEMLETILLGELFAVNPFDQPAVEAYKKETRRLLSGGKLA